VLTNVALTTGQRYRIGVFALSFDISKNAPLTKLFEIGEGRITVIAGAKPIKTNKKVAAPAKRMNVQVHGSALVGASSIKIVDLRVEGLPAKTSVVFRCVKGCTASEDLSGGGVVHSRILRDLTVPTGSVIEIRATKAGYVGFYDRLRLHATALGFFTETKMCLPAHGTKPHVCKNGH